MPDLTAEILAERQVARERRLATARAMLAAKIRAGVENAAAHARNALTETLRETPDGRATAAKVRRSRSYHAALARLDELRDAVVVFAEVVRGAEYRRAWRFWRGHLPADSLRPGADDAPEANLRRCRAAMLHGMTTRQEIEGRILPYRRRLLAALTVAGGRATRKADAADLIAQWAKGATDGIAATADAMLNDSFVLADRLAGRDVVRPELLDPDPSLPE